MATDNPYADSPDAGDDSACKCGGAWHAAEQHCVDWPCPGCDNICRPEGTEDWPMTPLDQQPDTTDWRCTAVLLDVIDDRVTRCIYPAGHHGQDVTNNWDLHQDKHGVQW